MELNTKVKFSIESFFQKKITYSVVVMKKNIISAKDLKKILNKKDFNSFRFSMVFERTA